MSSELNISIHKNNVLREVFNECKSRYSGLVTNDKLRSMYKQVNMDYFLYIPNGLQNVITRSKGITSINSILINEGHARTRYFGHNKLNKTNVKINRCNDVTIYIGRGIGILKDNLGTTCGLLSQSRVMTTPATFVLWNLNDVRTSCNLINSGPDRVSCRWNQ